MKQSYNKLNESFYYQIFNEAAQSANTPLNDASPIQKQMIQDKIAEMPTSFADKAKDYLRRNWKWLTVGAALLALGGAAYYNRDAIGGLWKGDEKVETPATTTVSATNTPTSKKIDIMNNQIIELMSKMPNEIEYVVGLKKILVSNGITEADIKSNITDSNQLKMLLTILRQ